MLVALVVLAEPKFPGLRERELPVPPLVFGIVAFCVILGLLALTFAFRSVGKRH